MTEVEHIPTCPELLEKVQKHEGWNPVYRRALEEFFRSSTFMAAMNEVLVQSDEVLKNVGLTDLTNELAVKNALRTQGVAQGLAQAVELICGLASEPETLATEEKDNV